MQKSINLSAGLNQSNMGFEFEDLGGGGNSNVNKSLISKVN